MCTIWEMCLVFIGQSVRRGISANKHGLWYSAAVVDRHFVQLNIVHVCTCDPISRKIDYLFLVCALFEAQSAL